MRKKIYEYNKNPKKRNSKSPPLNRKPRASYPKQKKGCWSSQHLYPPPTPEFAAPRATDPLS
jgi:hypothetical protein